MYQADKKHGITIDSVKEEYEKKNQVPNPSCIVELSQAEMNAEDDGFTPVKLENLLFPFMFYALFAIVASCLKFYTVRMQKMGKKGILDSRYLGSPETLGLGQKRRRRLPE